MTRWDGLATFLPSGDLDRSGAFYGDVLELPLVLDQGTCRIYQVTPSALIGLCLHLSPRPAAGVTTTLVTDAVDEWYERLQRAGVAIDAAPRLSSQYGIYHFYTEDPDGNRLEVQRFLELELSG